MKITMKTAEAIDRVMLHRDAHLAEYARQREGWQVAMEEFSRSLAAWSQGSAGALDRPVEPVEPQSFSEDYDKLLAVLQATIEDRVALDTEDQNHIIHDQFRWQHVFAQNSATYTGAR